jgi:hypothetical protein
VLESTLYPTFGATPIDEITVEDVNEWYEKVAPGRESQRARAYSLLRTILGIAGLILVSHCLCITLYLMLR